MHTVYSWYCVITGGFSVLAVIYHAAWAESSTGETVFLVLGIVSFAFAHQALRSRLNRVRDDALAANSSAGQHVGQRHRVRGLINSAQRLVITALLVYLIA